MGPAYLRPWAHSDHRNRQPLRASASAKATRGAVGCRHGGLPWAPQAGESGSELPGSRWRCPVLLLERFQPPRSSHIAALVIDFGSLF